MPSEAEIRDVMVWVRHCAADSDEQRRLRVDDIARRYLCNPAPPPDDDRLAKLEQRVARLDEEWHGQIVALAERIDGIEADRNNLVERVGAMEGKPTLSEAKAELGRIVMGDGANQLRQSAEPVKRPGEPVQYAPRPPGKFVVTEDGPSTEVFVPDKADDARDLARLRLEQDEYLQGELSSRINAAVRAHIPDDEATEYRDNLRDCLRRHILREGAGDA